MGRKKGRSIPCPLGRSAKRQRPKPTPQGSSQIIAELNASEARWVEQQSQRLGKPPPLANAPTQDDPKEPPPPDPFYPDRGFGEISDIDPQEVHDGHEQIPDNSHEVPPQVNNFGEYVRGSTYKEKQIKEARNWAKVFGPMFLDFMVGSTRTTQWGLDTWNQDYNQACSCGPGRHRMRNVDMVDLTSTIHFCFSSFH